MWRDDQKASIVIPVYNQLAYTRDCLDSIRHCTPQPHEVIVVDNGSSDGTGECLAELVAEGWPVQVLRNEQNRGFTRAANQGMTQASPSLTLTPCCRGAVCPQRRLAAPQRRSASRTASKCSAKNSQLEH